MGDVTWYIGMVGERVIVEDILIWINTRSVSRMWPYLSENVRSDE